MLHAIAKTYSSCVEQPVQRLFVALSAQLGHALLGGDAKDATAIFGHLQQKKQVTPTEDTTKAYWREVDGVIEVDLQGVALAFGLGHRRRHLSPRSLLSRRTG